MTGALLALSGLTKAYPGVLANDDVSLSIAPGEVHALLGENGAGKSTLVKMFYCLVAPYAGRMEMDGAVFAPSDPRAARSSGVGMVFQHLSLLDALSVAENIALGMEDPPKLRELSAQIREVSETHGLPLSPDRIVGDLSAGERQRVEIIRCLLGKPRLLIMDEPTSALSASEVEVLFGVIRDLKAKGVSIVYISHHLEEALTITDHAVVLRDGIMTAYAPRDEIDLEWIVRNMVGENFDLGTPPEGHQMGPPALELKGLCVPAASGSGYAVNHLDLSVRAGEVVCIYGLMGAGRTEMMECVAGG